MYMYRYRQVASHGWLVAGSPSYAPVMAPAPPLTRPRPPRWALPVLNTLERVGRKRQDVVPSSPTVRLLKLSATVVAMTILITLTMPLDGVKQKRHSYSFWRRWAGRLLYALTVINPCFSVAADNYTFLRDAASSLVLTTKREVQGEAEEKVRRLVFGLGAIRPRRVFAAGAMLRGVQLHTPFRSFFDPPAHFGATVNLLALLDGVAWPASFTLGWAVTEYAWSWGDPRLHERELDATEVALTPPLRGEASKKGVDVAATEQGVTPTWKTRRGGLRLQLHLPSVHACVTTWAFLAWTRRWRWVLLSALCAATWSGITDDADVRSVF